MVSPVPLPPFPLGPWIAHVADFALASGSLLLENAFDSLLEPSSPLLAAAGNPPPPKAQTGRPTYTGESNVDWQERESCMRCYQKAQNQGPWIQDRRTDGCGTVRKALGLPTLTV